MSFLERQPTPSQNEPIEDASKSLLQERRRAAVEAHQRVALQRKYCFTPIVEITFEVLDECLWGLAWILHHEKGIPVLLLREPPRAGIPSLDF